MKSADKLLVIAEVAGGDIRIALETGAEDKKAGRSGAWELQSVQTDGHAERPFKECGEECPQTGRPCC